MATINIDGVEFVVQGDVDIPVTGKRVTPTPVAIRPESLEAVLDYEFSNPNDVPVTITDVNAQSSNSFVDSVSIVGPVVLPADVVKKPVAITVGLTGTEKKHGDVAAVSFAAEQPAPA